MSETTKRNPDAKKIIGIKVSTSKKSGNKFYTYYVTNCFSDYEVENSEVQGISCESVGCSTDLDLNIGDIVEFNYGRAIGDYQPIKSATIIEKAAFKK